MVTGTVDRKVVGLLPGGGKLYRSELPEPGTRRWTIARKRVLVQAINTGLLSLDEARETYGLDTRELSEWRRDVLREPARLPNPEMDDVQRLVIGGMVIDRQDRKARVRGQEIELTEQEWTLLEFMAMRVDLMCSKPMILEHFYGDRENWRPQKIIDVLICRLRAKLFDATGEPDRIVTVWGRGFLLSSQEEQYAKAVGHH